MLKRSKVSEKTLESKNKKAHTAYLKCVANLKAQLSVGVVSRYNNNTSANGLVQLRDGVCLTTSLAPQTLPLIRRMC